MTVRDIVTVGGIGLLLYAAWRQFENPAGTDAVTADVANRLAYDGSQPFTLAPITDLTPDVSSNPFGIGDIVGSSLPSLVTTMTAPAGMSANAVQTIRNHEGLRLTRYDDVGHSAIGYGHDITSADNIGQTITTAQAEQLLAQDVATVNAVINGTVRVPLTQNQYDAIGDLIFNIGQTAWQNSTMLAKLNAGDYAGAVNEFGRWVYAGGKVNQSLVNMRAAERELFLS